MRHSAARNATILLGLPMVTCFCTNVNAQNAQKINKEIPPTRLNTNMIEEVKRVAIPFKGWELMDPKTRKAVGPNDKITLPSGRVVPAGEYYKQLNAIEADLNRIGTTLKDKQQKQLLVKQAVIDKTALSVQARTISALHKPAVATLRFQPAVQATSAMSLLRSHTTEADAPAFGLNATQLRTNMAKMETETPQIENIHELATRVNVTKIDPGLFLPKKPNPVPIPVHQSYPFNWSVGSTSTFQAYLRGKATIDGQAVKLSNPPKDSELMNAANRFTIHGDATAGAYIFGNNISVLSGNADFSADNKQCRAAVDISVLGQSVYQLNETAPSKWVKTGSLSKSCDFHTTIDIPVSILTLSVKVGAAGQAGINYGVSLYAPMAFAQGSVSPFVHTNAYAQAGIGIGGSWLGVDGGVGGNVTLINYDMDINARVGLLWFINYGLFEELNIHNKLDLLSGRLYVFAEFNHPCFPDFWNGCSNQVSVDIWNWAGFHTEGDLLNFKNSHPL